MSIERRIREGAERNAGMLDPDVDRFLESVVSRNHRREIVRRCLVGVAVVSAFTLIVAVGPGLLQRTEAPRVIPAGTSTPSAMPGVTAPFLTGRFTRSVRPGTAVVRVNGIAGEWTINAGTDGEVRLLAPESFTGADVSHPFELQASTLLTDALSSDVCAGLGPGRYSWFVRNGFLLLSVRSDPCDARIVILTAKPWAVRP